MTLLHFTIGINATILVHVAALIFAVWLAARVAARQFQHGRSVAATTAIPILFAAFGSMPFYTAYLMPDIFAPILIFIAATLAIFARDMSKGEILIALILGVLSVVTHPSHLMIAVLLIPIVAIASLIMARTGWWLAPLLLIAITLGGLAERVVFASVQANCPNAEMPTCVLYEALQKSDDPWRLTASHIMFERDPNLGSYKLLPIDDQRRVAEDQIPFFLQVFMERPLALIGSFLQNTLDQANLFSIQFTIPTSKTLENVNTVTDIAPASFERARLIDQRSGLAWLKTVHGAVYAVSALLVVVIVVLPQKVPPLAFRGFAMVILIGILINAFVCGGVSQPSDRITHNPKKSLR